MNVGRLNVTGSNFIQGMKTITPPSLWAWVYRKLVIKDIPGSEAYAPHYQPWREPQYKAEYQTIQGRTACPADSVYMLTALARKSLVLPGDVMEAGVWRGGTAKILLRLLNEHSTVDHKNLFLFDSFEGMKNTTASQDRHLVGDFADTSLESVSHFLGEDERVHFCKGWIPKTFAGLENSTFCFAHIDLDLYQSIKDCLGFAYPRMSKGGVIVLDDYGYASCPGARKSADEFFLDKPEKVLALHTGQGIVFISP